LEKQSRVQRRFRDTISTFSTVNVLDNDGTTIQLHKVLASVYVEFVDKNDDTGVEIFFATVPMKEIIPGDSNFVKGYLPYPQYRLQMTRGSFDDHVMLTPSSQILSGSCCIPFLREGDSSFSHEDNAAYCRDNSKGLWYNLPRDRLQAKHAIRYSTDLANNIYGCDTIRKLNSDKVFHTNEFLRLKQTKIVSAVEADLAALAYERKISARRVASAAAIDRRLAARKAGECDCGGDEDDQDGEDESSDLIDRPLAERSGCAAGRS